MKFQTPFHETPKYREKKYIKPTYISSKIEQTLTKIKNKKPQNQLNFNQNQN